MNDPNLKNTMTQAINIIKKILDGLIISIFIALPVILILGAINAVFELDGPMRIGGIQTAGLGSDFGLVLRIAFAFAALGAVLAVLRHGGAIWRWLKSRPVVGGLVGLVFVLLVTAWLISIFRKSPGEQLALAIGDANLDRVQTVLGRNEFEISYLDLQLSRSVEEGKFEIATALIVEGADVNRAKDFGDYPLLISTIIFGEKDAILFLIEQGADPNQIDEIGRTPLITLITSRLAMENINKADSVVVAKALLAAGADPALTDDLGKSAKDYAKSREVQELLVLFP